MKIKDKKKKKINKIDVYIIIMSIFVLAFILWCSWEFHCGRDEPTALIGLVGAYVVTELFSLAKIKAKKEETKNDEPVG